MKLVVLHHLANHLLKCAAVILSVLCWLQINYNRDVHCSVEVPLLFDHTNIEHTLHAPETITLHVLGTRNALYALDRTESAVHIDARDLQPGEHTVVVSRDTFFLPDSITMLDYTPCNISVD